MAIFISHTVTHPILTRCPRTSLLGRGRGHLPGLSFTKLSPLHSSSRRYIGNIISDEQENITKAKYGSLVTLAIETSCDDTCVAILEKSGPVARILFNRKITADNRKFNGINPLIAVDSHAMSLSMLVQESLQSLPMITYKALSPSGQVRITTTRHFPDFVSVTRGPGIQNCLMVGLHTAKGLAVAWDVPLVAVHHMQAHALTPRLLRASTQFRASPSSPLPLPLPTPSSPLPSPSDPHNPKFPFLTLLVSGGHTQLVLSNSLITHSILADTPDIAVGDMLDKVARAVLPVTILSSTSDVSFGPILESFAFPEAATQYRYTYDNYTPPINRESEIQPWTNAERDWSIPAPLAGTRDMEFNFTGLGSKIRVYAATLSQDDIEGRRLLARAAMKLAFEHIASRIIFALTERKKAAAIREFEDLKTDNLRYKRKITQALYGEETLDSLQTLVVSGGVASNRYLEYILKKTLDTRGFRNVNIVVPPPAFCTDNAAMIAWAGMEMYEAGWRSPLDVTPVRRWSLDPEREPTKMRSEKGRAVVGILDGQAYQSVEIKKSFNQWMDEKGLTLK